MAAEKQVSSVIVCGCGSISPVLAGAVVRLKEEAAGRKAQSVLMAAGNLAETLKQVRRKHKQAARIHVVGVEAWPEEALEPLRAAKKDGVQVVRYAPAPLPAESAKRFAGLVQEVVGDVQPFEYFVLTSRPTLTVARLRTADVLAHSAGNAFFNELHRTAVFICRMMPGRPESCAEVAESLMQHLCSLSKEAELSPVMRRYRDVYRQYGRREMLGGSAEMDALRTRIAKVAAADDVRVLICGETGTGKENVATCLHLNSRRWQKPLLHFHGATAPQQAERLLLGYKKNAFPGATQDRKGLLEEAQGGTLFLDEVADMPMETQTLLLHVLDAGRILPLGATKEVAVDVRVVASTNKDLRQEAAAGRFRTDLLHRLQEFTLHSPSLRQMQEDIPRLANSLWRTRSSQPLPGAAVPVLLSHPWPGNVRELGNFLKYAHIMGGNDWPALLQGFLSMETAIPAPLPAGSPATPAPAADSTPDTPMPLDDVMRTHCQRVLALCHGNQSRAAEHLGISRNTLRRYV